jgi:hypothetical protein
MEFLIVLHNRSIHQVLFENIFSSLYEAIKSYYTRFYFKRVITLLTKQDMYCFIKSSF